jgi:hypothetical protein
MTLLVSKDPSVPDSCKAVIPMMAINDRLMTQVFPAQPSYSANMTPIPVIDATYKETETPIIAWTAIGQLVGLVGFLNKTVILFATI